MTLSSFRSRLGHAFVLALLASLVGAATAAAVSPRWSVDPVSNTSAPAGGAFEYIAQATNLGDGPTDGSTIVLRGTLAPGMTITSVADVAGSTFTCTAGDGSSPVVGASTLECQAPQTLGPTQSVGLVINVALAGGAAGVLTSRFDASGGGAAPASSVRAITVRPQAPPFGVETFDGLMSDVAGDPMTQAGGHPYEFSTYIDFNTTTNPNPALGPLWPVEPTKDVVVDLPPGIVGNPTVVGQCKIAELANAGAIQPRPLCLPDSQVGTVMVRALGVRDDNGSVITGPLPLYNVLPPDGVPAEFGFNLYGSVITFSASVRTNGDYGLSVLSAKIPQALAVSGTTVTFWGVPADPSHDPQRSCPGLVGTWQGGPPCPLPNGTPQRALLRNSTSCEPQPGGPSDGLATLMHMDSWVSPGRFNADGSPDLSDPSWQSTSYVSHALPAYPVPPVSDQPPLSRGAHLLPTGCDNVPFAPTLGVTPDAPLKAGSPAGVAFDVSLPQSDDPTRPGESDLRKAVVALPPGLHVSSSSANGLQGCTEAQIGLHSAADATCPDGSKIGSVTLTTPLLLDQLRGAVYLAQPHQNPFGTLIAMYVVVQGHGVTVKLAGKVDADPVTGQLTTTFDDNPQLPFSNLRLQLDGGPKAPLMAPTECGTYQAQATFTPWSGQPPVVTPGTFTVDQAADGGACRPPGFSPTLRAGTTPAKAGADTSFALRLSRGDGDQELKRLTAYMPTGVTGRIVNVEKCGDAAANAGTCGEASRIGTVTVGAGAGPNPFYITNGRAYLTGPYGGAPYGLSIVVRAVAGPFDLGDVIVRSAIFVDRHTAQLKIVSDPFPTILQGIPLDVRDVRVKVDKPHFMLNPTSCAEKQVRGTVESLAGATASVETRFGVTGCDKLSFRPRLTLSVGAKGRTRAGASTPFSSTLSTTPGMANLGKVKVTLPTTLNARLPVLNRACEIDEFEAGHCEQARAGTAVAVTPLLRDPLRGSVYFVWNRASRRPLPDLVVALRGEVSADVVGKTGVDPKTLRLSTSFDTIPDIPVTRFTLRLVAGRQGPLGTIANLCSRRARRAKATIDFRGQNGAATQVQQRMRIVGCPRR